MARRPFDPASFGLRKTEYRRGDVLDRDAVDALVADADVVVHLAFIIMGGEEETRQVNLEGSRTVFEAAAASRARRLVYTSSVAAYGFHDDNPQPLTEDVPARGSGRTTTRRRRRSSRRRWRGRWPARRSTRTSCGRASSPGRTRWPCWRRSRGRSAGAPLTVLPDPGTRFQLVHHDDVASALVAAARGAGPPGRLQPRRPGRADGARPRPRARLDDDPGPARDGLARRPRSRAPARPGQGPVAERVPHPGAR